ncbi:hypothetical protein DXG03_006159 [Asterophora parasitica]|uniref:RING-type domain-containing protein n=1 Tax=Asterophora parasitica TaxID=117018 RepID=A0A9P7GCV7_9AGAR|nr:hypothetical protein DXG03_006159 [Asterophora parasitica]
MSEDEFDNIPDEFAGVEGVDWGELLSAPPPPSSLADASPLEATSHEAIGLPSGRSPTTSSTHYSCDDEVLDPAFLLELDAVEESILLAEVGPSTAQDTHVYSASGAAQPDDNGTVLASGTGAPSPFPQVDDSSAQSSTRIDYHSRFFSDAVATLRPPPASSSSRQLPKLKEGEKDESPLRAADVQKRPRAETPLPTTPSQSKKGKSKAEGNEGVLRVLSGFEDELTCPICSDIFVAAHLGNPCGHSFCGECGWNWKLKCAKLGNPNSCSICRTVLSGDMPMISNFAMDNTIEKHIAALGESGRVEWKPGGTSYADWMARKE